MHELEEAGRDRAPRYSVQRLVRRRHSHPLSNNLWPKSPDAQPRPAMPRRWECNREPREIHEKKSASTHAILPSLQTQQEVTEETEDAVPLRSLRCLLFKPPRVAHRRTTEVSDRRWKLAVAETGNFVKPKANKLKRGTPVCSTDLVSTFFHAVSPQALES